jgi:cytochrome P450
LEPRIRQICVSLIEKFADRGECEFSGEFSSLFPSSVTLLMLGLPHDMLEQFLAWENQFLRGGTIEIRTQATRELYDYFGTLLRERRRQPRDDMVSMIANSAIDGRRLAENEACGMCIMLYIGGLDSVTSGLGWYMRHLALDRDLQSKLRHDPGLIPAAIEEFVRIYGLTTTMRTVTEDTVFHGVAMQKDDIVALPAFLGSRDPREYADPHRFELDRMARTMTFGAGVHKCAGIHLAKCEIRIVLEEFLSRFAALRIPEGQDPLLTTKTIWDVKRLPLNLEN